MIRPRASYIDLFSMLRRGGWLALVCASLAIRPGLAQQPAAGVHASVDSARIRIGEQFHLLLEAHSEGPVRWQWAEVPDSFDHLLVVARGKIDTVSTAGKTVLSQRLTLTGFDSGYWQVPAFDFRIASADTTGGAGLFSTDSLGIAVNTVPVDTTKPFRPIKQIRGVPVNWLSYWPYALGALLLLALIIWLAFFRKSAEKASPAPVAPSDPPYEEAVKSLRQLETDKLWQQNQVKTYYTRLTDILRRYIERQFGIHAMEQTTEELLGKIKPLTKLNQQQGNLRYILDTADLAKFAKIEPLPDAHEASLKKAYEILEWTRPKEESVTGEKEQRSGKTP